MKIAIYGKSFNDSFIPHVQLLLNGLLPHAELIVFEPFLSFLKPRISGLEGLRTFTRDRPIDPETDYCLSVGGDGTFLDTITFIRDTQIPVIGINTGRLGFLSNISKDEIPEMIHSIFTDNLLIADRSLIQVDTTGDLFGNDNIALNELTIHKKDSSSMITIHTYVDGDYLNSYWADGLIVATPTGSTAYSLSCGGPIIVPQSHNFILTPIAPHNLNVRPVVVPDNVTITLRVEGRGEEFLASLDSRSETINSSSTINVRKCPFNIRLGKLEHQNFFHTIRNKMMWGIDKRN